jgi:hypothetical protein
MIADKTTKLPLENVGIYNDKDNSTTNQEGTFVFFSDKNEINFNLLGYNSFKTTFEEIEKKDTIFMEAKIFELKEIVIANLELFVKKAYDKIGENYISNYTSNFFLRNVLKKDTSIVVLQDIHAIREKSANIKNSNQIQILNMRKTSFFDKKNSIDFQFPNFEEFLSGSYPPLDKIYFSEEEYNDVDFRKILFEAKEKNVQKQIQRGYFIININDFAIVEFFVSQYDNPEVLPFNKFTFTKSQFRTTKYERFFRQTKDSILNKYYVSISKLNAQVEVLVDGKSNNAFNFNVTMDYFNTKKITNERVNSNFAVDKDIFKAKFPYSVDFWNNQNQLPLTNELKDFLKRVSENKDKKKQFEIIGNF